MKNILIYNIPYLDLSVKTTLITMGIILAVFITKKIFNKIIFKWIYKKIDDMLLDEFQDDILNNVSKLKKPFSRIFDLAMFHIFISALPPVHYVKHAFSFLYFIVAVWTSMIFVDILFSLYLYHKEESTKRSEIVNLTRKFTKTVLFLAILLITLQLNGINVTTLIASLSVLGVAVGLAAKDTLANIFSSLSILMENTFSVKDYIKTKNVEGHVVEIGIRSTTIRSQENALVTVPNSELASSYIQNFSRRSIGRMIKLNFALSYENKKSNIINAIDEIRVFLKEHEQISKDEEKSTATGDKEGIKDTISVHLVEPTANALNIGVTAYSKSIVAAEWLAVQESVIFGIWDIFERNEIIWKESGENK